jgi:hypothetical protein
MANAPSCHTGDREQGHPSPRLPAVDASHYPTLRQHLADLDAPIRSRFGALTPRRLVKSKPALKTGARFQFAERHLHAVVVDENDRLVVIGARLLFRRQGSPDSRHDFA